jgi:predicted membrane protein
MHYLQSFLWLILGIVIVYIIFRIARSFIKWVLIILLIGILLYYYQPSRQWLNKTVFNNSK